MKFKIYIYDRSLHKSNVVESPEILFSFTKLMAQRLRYKFLVTKEMTSQNPEHRITTLISHFKKDNQHI